jgi:galactokinase
VAWALWQEGVALSGADLLIRSDLPPGGGLSSSAALEVAAALALLGVSGGQLDPRRIALACQRAEHVFAGVNCGIMDQWTALFARAGCALLLDCRALESRAVPLANGATFVVANTMTHHALAASEYNTRRRECAEALERARALVPAAQTWRDFSWEQIAPAAEAWPAPLARRARHILTEIERTRRAAEALAGGDFPAMGLLMNESHESLANNFAVSSAELDAMVRITRSLPGVYGARLTGGGFGGCVIVLAASDAAQFIAGELAARYAEKCGVEPAVEICHAAGPAGEVPGGAEEQ